MIYMYTYVRQNRERCFFKREKNDTSDQKSQRCVGFAPKFPRFIGACSALASQTISNYKKNILNWCWLEESLHYTGGAWLKLGSRDHQSLLRCLSSHSNFSPIHTELSPSLNISAGYFYEKNGLQECAAGIVAHQQLLMLWPLLILRARPRLMS